MATGVAVGTARSNPGPYNVMSFGDDLPDPGIEHDTVTAPTMTPRAPGFWGFVSTALAAWFNYKSLEKRNEAIGWQEKTKRQAITSWYYMGLDGHRQRNIENEIYAAYGVRQLGDPNFHDINNGRTWSVSDPYGQQQDTGPEMGVPPGFHPPAGGTGDWATPPPPPNSGFIQAYQNGDISHLDLPPEDGNWR